MLLYTEEERVAPRFIDGGKWFVVVVVLRNYVSAVTLYRCS